MLIGYNKESHVKVYSEITELGRWRQGDQGWKNPVGVSMKKLAVIFLYKESINLPNIGVNWFLNSSILISFSYNSQKTPSF